MKKVLLFVFAIGFTSIVHAAELPPGFTEQLIAQNLDPTDIALLPDGRIFITFKNGAIMVVEDGILRSSPLINLQSKVDNYNERGLGHIVLDTQFATNGYYYVYYTVKGENHNRVSRFTATGNFSDPSSEVIILDLPVMAGTIHNAGDMDWGNDGKLYISVGDGSDGSTAQSLGSILGKVLRINKDGSIPSDNPFYTQAAGVNRAIFALGFRNPFSLDISDGSGEIFISDVGQGTWEEVNHVMAGANYGWPGIEGKRTTQALPAIGMYHDPLVAYPHGGGENAGCAIVGAAFYNPATVQFPSTFTGRFFYGDYCNGYIKSVDPENGNDTQIFATGINRPLAVVVAADGSLYYLARAGIGGGSQTDNTSTNNGTLWKVTFTGSGAPFIGVNPQPTTVSVGESARFSVQASGTDPLSYQWKKNGNNINGATSAEYELTNAQLADNNASFVCVVSNSLGDATSEAATLTVTANQRPTPSITYSLLGGAEKYKAGETITFSGTATDPEDGALPASSLTWKIDFHHAAHTHPALADESGSATATYLIPRVGETSDDVWYRVYLTATDLGTPVLSQTVYKDIYPLKTTINLATSPANLGVILDGQPVQTPFSFTSVQGVTRTLEAPGFQKIGNTFYVFSEWSEEGAERMFHFDTPETETTFTASFDTSPAGNGDGLAASYFTNQDKTFMGEPTLQRVDSTINFNWGGGSPAPQISADTFTARWTGHIKPMVSGTHTFYLTGDDGVRMWINDELLINGWVDQGATTYEADIDLDNTHQYSIKVEFYENGGDATIDLQWSAAEFEKQFISKSQFYTELTTGIEPGKKSLVVYPTVVESDLHVENGRDTTWMIVNMMGQVVHQGKMEKSLRIQLNDLAPGLYLLKTGNEVTRFVKK